MKLIGKIFFLIAAFFTVYVLVSSSKSHAEQLSTIQQQQQQILGYHSISQGALGKIQSSIITPEPIDIEPVDEKLDLILELITLPKTPINPSEYAREQKSLRDVEFLLGVQELGRYSSHWFKATGTGDKIEQINRIMYGAGGGVDQIRASGYPSYAVVAGTFDTLLPFEETELGKKYFEEKLLA